MSDKALSFDISLTRGAFKLSASADVAAQKITAVFGPSGAGKSSLLRAISGFDSPDDGRIILSARTLFDKGRAVNVPPHERGVGYMFQDARLFSHLNVKGNLKFAQSRAPQGGASFEHVVSAFDLSRLLDKDSAILSGGERQRVAMARTVLSRPSVLLLDEPFAGLDAAKKSDLMPFIRALSDDFGMSVILVSHDLKDVGTLADNIMCLENGQIASFGPALDVLPKLQTEAAFLPNYAAWFEGIITSCDTDIAAARLSLSADHNLVLPLTASMRRGDKCRISIRADDVSIALSPPENISIQNAIKARIKSVTPSGARVHVTLCLPDDDTVLPNLSAFITPLAQSKLQLQPGQFVTALVKSVSLSR